MIPVEDWADKLIELVDEYDLVAGSICIAFDDLRVDVEIYVWIRVF